MTSGDCCVGVISIYPSLTAMFNPFHTQQYVGVVDGTFSNFPLAFNLFSFKIQ